LPPPVTSPSLPAVERRSTFYTSAKISAARVNIAKYPWAAAMKRAAVSGAAKLVAATDEWVWSALSGQGLPRSYAVNQDLGSPITGHGLYKYGAYAWQADPFGKPWKLKDPSSGYTFPTNDFDAFYRSGLDQHGNFNRSLADRRLLVNTSYPERGPTWGVDDGFGWVDDTGDKWTFIAYYVHWFLWYGGLAFSALQAARDAYLYTGAIKYAHTGLILLDRVADLYPAMDTAPYRREDGYLNSGALTPEGEVLGKAVGNILGGGAGSELGVLLRRLLPGDRQGRCRGGCWLPQPSVQDLRTEAKEFHRRHPREHRTRNSQAGLHGCEECSDPRELRYAPKCARDGCRRPGRPGDD